MTANVEDIGYIRDIWDSKAKLHQGSTLASWKDGYGTALERLTHIDLLKGKKSVMDAGCGNGRPLLEHEAAATFERAVGLDYSHEMIQVAKKEQASNFPSSVAEFHQTSILDLSKDLFGTFDVVYTTRVLINLPTWDMQLAAIRNCLDCLEAGGILLLSEAFFEPLVKVNSLRSVLSLPPLTEHDFNRYIKKPVLEKAIEDLGHTWSCIPYMGVYYFGTRVLRETLSNAAELEGYESDFHKEWFEMEKRYDSSETSIQQMYVIEKC